MSPEQRARYDAAVHRQQTAVAFGYQRELSDVLGDPIGPRGADLLIRALKHLRVGTNNAMADQGALAKLLIAKGVISEAEYCEAITVAAEEEADRFVADVRRIYNIPPHVHFM